MESRLLETSLRRRRECSSCKNRFTTYEQAHFQLCVIKKDGREEGFDLQKITRSIEKALGKAEPEILISLSQKIYQKILNKKKNPLKSQLIGKLVLQELKRVDKIAYLRFASIHKAIDDPKLFEKEIDMITKNVMK